MFIALAITGYALLGVVALLDKFILSKKISSPLTYSFYISTPFIFLFLVIPFGIQWPVSMYDWIFVVGSGLFFLAGLCLMFLGIKKSEISHVGPLVGATVSLSSVILGRLFLGEILPLNKIIGISFLIIGALIISFEKSKKHNGIHLGMLWGVLAGVCFSASYIVTKFIYNDLGFWSGLVWSKGILGLGGLCLLLSPIVRKEIRQKNGTKEKTSKGIVLINLILSVVGVLLIQFAISIGSVSVVSAFEGLKYAILIILVALLSWFFPKILKEDYAKGEIVQEILAIFLICLGLIILI